MKRVQQKFLYKFKGTKMIFLISAKNLNLLWIYYEILTNTSKEPQFENNELEESECFSKTLWKIAVTQSFTCKNSNRCRGIEMLDENSTSDGNIIESQKKSNGLFLQEAPFQVRMLLV